ncbi:DUF1643 domain-containing protein [Heliorestis convoluta]|uniref:DUF1643 domain-containing protein n=1 Tax=Heliorestis convoluta TaxID=356322 RepID=A0A5Q2MWM7_9FIRM|nr:DUF1643 domain-containing protein [Heliorestis convoluta]QGG46848.1 hypothetical protein FTV88_0670 [Heliorestis convoluta]
MKRKEGTIKNIAVYSDDEKYRYSLTRIWDENKPRATFIGINPSDATELIMDKTVMNLTNHLIYSGYGIVEIVNLFSFRSKDPSILINRKDEFEQPNMHYIKEALNNSQLIIVGWGRNVEKKSAYKAAIAQIKGELSKYSKIVKCFKDKKGNINCHLSIGYSDEWELVEYGF